MSIQSELLEIKGNQELLTAEAVVDWARSHPQSDLYHSSVFCGWDEKKSAYEHWLYGARKLIALHVVYKDGERRLISLSTDRLKERGGYRDRDDVLRNQSLYEIMLADALRELERLQAKYNTLKSLQPVWQAVENVRSRRRKAA